MFVLSLLPPVKSQGNPRNRGLLEGPSSAVLEEGPGAGGTVFPIWILEQSQSSMSVAEVPEWSPPPLASPCGRGAGEEHGLRSQILVGILAHHLLAIHLGQCPPSEPQFPHLLNGGEGQSFLVGLS